MTRYSNTLRIMTLLLRMNLSFNLHMFLSMLINSVKNYPWLELRNVYASSASVHLFYLASRNQYLLTFSVLLFNFISLSSGIRDISALGQIPIGWVQCPFCATSHSNEGRLRARARTEVNSSSSASQTEKPWMSDAASGARV